MNRVVTDVRPCTEAKLTPASVSFPEAMSCPGSCKQALKGCSPQVEVKSRKTKENGISHLREMALIHQRGKSLHQNQPSYRVFQQKLLENNEHKSPPVQKFIWPFSIV